MGIMNKKKLYKLVEERKYEEVLDILIEKNVIVKEIKDNYIDKKNKQSSGLLKYGAWSQFLKQLDAALIEIIYSA